MSRILTVVYSGTITNAGGDVDLLELSPASNRPVLLRGFSLAQTSEVGDSAEEGLRISIIRLEAVVTSGSGGSTVTARAMDSANPASNTTCECNNTTIATTTGSSITVFDFAWNIRLSPYSFWFPDSQIAPRVNNGERLVVRQQTTAADDYEGAFTFWIEEA